MQSAEIHQFPAQERQAPKGPQLEDGYTRIANELFEAVTNAQTCPVTLRQMRVVLAVIRKTYGFNKKADRISDGQIAADTGLSRQNVNKAKRELIAMNVLFMDGHKIGVNKYSEQWDFSAKPEKDNLRQTRDSVSKSETQNVSKNGSHKRQKDINTSTDVEVRIGEPNRDEAEVDKSPPEIKLPDCPHQEILKLWAEVMPEKRQPSKNLWSGSPREKALATRWKQCFSLKRDSDNKVFYTNREEGIDWWRRFFKYLRKSPFLMESDFVDLEWICKRKWFERILERKYHEEVGA